MSEEYNFIRYVKKITIYDGLNLGSNFINFSSAFNSRFDGYDYIGLSYDKENDVIKIDVFVEKGYGRCKISRFKKHDCSRIATSLGKEMKNGRYLFLKEDTNRSIIVKHN